MALTNLLLSLSCVSVAIFFLADQTIGQNTVNLDDPQLDIHKRSLPRDEEYYADDENLEDVAYRWHLDPMDLLLQFGSRKRRDAIKKRNALAPEAALAPDAALAPAALDGEPHLRVRRADDSSDDENDRQKLTRAEKRRLRKEHNQRRKEQRRARNELRRQARQRIKQERFVRRRDRQAFRKAIRQGDEAVLERMLNIDIDMEIDMEKVCKSSSHHASHSDDVTCDPEDKYRTLDGSCNNLNDPAKGSALHPLVRWLGPEYSKHGKNGKFLPRRYYDSPRKQSTSFAGIDDGSDDLAQSGVSILIMHWGQFTDHDATHTPAAHESCDCRSLNSSCFPLSIPSDDPFFKDQSHECFEIPRSLSHCGDVNKREQFNEITSFIDASNVYGSTDGECKHLRYFSDEGYSASTTGRLRVHELPDEDPPRNPLLPHQPLGNCFKEEEGKIVCGEAGDFRVNEQPGLTSLHTIFVRLHNKVAEELLSVNPHWVGENDLVFQEARKIVGAIMQAIDYNEYLPTILGGEEYERYIGSYQGYDDHVDPSISNVFATSGYRQGHSAVDSELYRYRIRDAYPDENRCSQAEQLPPLPIRDAFFNAFFMYDFKNDGLDAFVQGMIRQKARKIDRFFTDTLLNRLFVGPDDADDATGLDLLSLNILRGRDHGIPPYHRWRNDYCQLPPIKRWDDLLDDEIVSEETFEALQKAYGKGRKKWKNIDAFIGFMAEEPTGKGATLGPTLSCILGTQFRNLRDGDRFFYLNPDGPQAFTEAQRNAIDKMTMARVLCLTLDNPVAFQKNVFKLEDSESNNCFDCSYSDAIPQLDLSAWAV